MAAMVFGPDRAGRASRPRTGLVLGAGGVLGAAWMTGALVGMQDRLPWSAATFHEPPSSFLSFAQYSSRLRISRSNPRSGGS